MTQTPTEYDWLIELLDVDVDDKLTRRQREALGYLLSTHKTIDWIAWKMSISSQTAKNHCHAVYKAIGVSGRLELLSTVVNRLMYLIRMK